MPILLQCVGCRSRMNAPDTAAGKKVKCPKCGAAVPIPAAPEETDALSRPADFVPQTINTMHAVPPMGGPSTVGPRPVVVATQLTQGAATIHAGPTSWPSVSGYEIVGELGRGGMGVVYMARQLKANRLVALKMIVAGKLSSPQEQMRFQIEAESIAHLQHPNIVQLHEVGEHDGMPYFSLEFCDGGSLEGKLKTWTPTPVEAAELIETLARAMHYAHLRGVVHRDLKPANILLAACGFAEEGAKPQAAIPKITDFGLAKQLDSGSDISRSGTIMGTPSYMAPEQAEGKVHDTGPATDIYALGVILYELLAGRTPFKGETAIETIQQVMTDEPTPPSRLRKGVPRDLETVCLKCLEKIASKRYASGADLADDLGRWRRGEPVEARAVGRIERGWRWCGRNALVASLLAGVALSLIVGTVTAWCLALAAGASERLARDNEAAADREKLIAQTERDRAEEEKRTADNERQRADTERDTALREKDKAQRSLAVGTLLRAGLIFENDPGGALALLEDRQSIPPELRDPAWGFYRNTCRRKLRELPGCNQPVLSVAWSPDGTTLATASQDGTIRLFDAATGKERASLIGHQNFATSVAFSPDGKTLASAGWDQKVKLWDVDARKERAALTGHTAPVRSVAWSVDGQTLASASEDRTIVLWDIITLKPRIVLKGHDQAVYSVSWSPDGKSLASGGGDGAKPGECKLWDALTGKERAALQGHTSRVYATAWSKDSRTVATAGWDADHRIRLWDAVGGNSLGMLEGSHNHGIFSLAWSPNGEMLASSGEDKTVKLWDVARRRELASFNGHTLAVHAVAFSPDSRTLASTSKDRTVKLWDAVGGPERTVLRGLSPTPQSLSLSRDGTTLASGGWDGTIKIWDMTTGKSTAVLQGKDIIWSMAFSPDSRTLASASGQFTLQGVINPPGDLLLWDPTTRQVRKTLTGHAHSVRSVAFSPDGGTLASASVDTTIKLWDVAEGRERATLKGHQSHVWSVAFSPDGRTLASASDDKTIKLWDAADGGNTRTLVAVDDAGPLTNLSWSRDGKLLASSGWDQTIRLWDVAAGKHTATLKGHQAVVWATAWSPDNKTLASACGDHTIRLWDVSSSQVRATLKTSSPVSALVWSEDGKTLISGEVGLVKLWDLDTDR